MKKQFTKIISSFLVVCLASFLSISSTVFAAEDIDYQAISQQIAKDVEAYRIPAMAVIVVDKDQVVFQETYGENVSPDSPFIIGSMSKSFTALAIMQLVEKGKVDLNAPISTYIDASKWFVKDGQDEKVTVRDLLHHTGGLGTYQTFGHLEITDSYGKHLYANANYGLLGLIIEAVSGESYESYVTKHIFQPLKMSQSSASLQASIEKGLIAGYRNYFGLPISGPADYPGPIDRGSWGSVPAGYLSASVSDMGRYLQMYLRDGEGIIGKESVQQMFYDTVPVDDEGLQYGLGWGYTEKRLDQPLLVHAGLVENYTSKMFILPEKGIGVVVLVNMNDYLVTNNVLDTIVNPLLGEPRKDLPNHYLLHHLAIDALYLLLTILSIYSFITIGKWKRKEKGMKTYILDILRHFLLPVGLLCLPLLVGSPPRIIWLFVKDLFVVLYFNACALFLIGVYKLFFIWKNRQNQP